VPRRLTIAASQTIAEHLVPHWLVELRRTEQAGSGPGGGERDGAERDGGERGGAEQGGGEQGGSEQGGSEQGAGGDQPTVVELTAANSAVVVERVRDGRAELGFIETPHRPAGLVTAPLRDDEMLLVTAPGHPWAGRRRPLPLAQVAATPLVIREAGSGTRDTLADYLAAQDPPLKARVAMEVGTTAAVRSAIAEGVGPGVLSRLAVRDDLVLGRLVAVEVAGPPLTRRLTAVWRPDHDPLGPAAARLLAVAQRG
jgi:DNA-binding transcriptional LysR family regulator